MLLNKIILFRIHHLIQGLFYYGKQLMAVYTRIIIFTLIQVSSYLSIFKGPYGGVFDIDHFVKFTIFSGN
jgi:hypothetical protein